MAIPYNVIAIHYDEAQRRSCSGTLGRGYEKAFVGGAVLPWRGSAGAQDWSLTLDEAQMSEAAGLYEQNCALCHGEDRSGYAADHAPSLKSPQLLSTGFPSHLRAAIGYGRRGTAMAAYSERWAGPCPEGR